MKQATSILLMVLSMLATSLPIFAADAPSAKLKPLGTSTPELGAPASVAQPSAAVPFGTPKSYKDPYTGMEFVFVKGGCYQMGDMFNEYSLNMKFTSHEVCVDDFYMGKYEVTQGEWFKVTRNNPSHFLKCGVDCPVEQVSWDDVTPFIARMRKNGGKSYRLPTEAEWEYAARSGGKKEKFAGGENLDDLAWYMDNAGMRTQPVGTKRPNGLGIYDMSGNVAEWCSDWFDYDYYAKSPKSNPEGPAQFQESTGGGAGETVKEPSRVVRGGAWVVSDVLARVAARGDGRPSDRLSNVGFRLVFSP